MSTTDPNAQFEQIVLPHLDAAYNLARWLSGNDHDAEDIAQEASLRAFRFLGGFRGANSRSWVLTIVRNTAFTWLKQNRAQSFVSMSDCKLEEIEDTSPVSNPGHTHQVDGDVLRHALASLPVEFREVLVLRELEGLSYKEIADVADAPIGTVMSRLARARKLLQEYLNRKGAQ